jgi:hypothetical protein
MGSERSLARGLEAAVRIAWIVGLGIGLFVVSWPLVMYIASADDLTGPLLPVTIRATGDGLDFVHPRTDAFDEASLVVEDAMIEFRPVPAAVWAASYVAGLLAYALSMLILHRLMKITGTLTDGRPFTPANASRIRAIGLAVIAMWFVDLAGRIAVQQFVRHHFTLDRGSFAWIGEMSLGIPFLGLLIVVISEVFRIGTHLQDDHDATI